MHWSAAHEELDLDLQTTVAQQYCFFFLDKSHKTNPEASKLSAKTPNSGAGPVQCIGLWDYWSRKQKFDFGESLFFMIPSIYPDFGGYPVFKY